MTRTAAAPVLSVAVLVELAATPDAGGHVKCWERFAEAAAGAGARELGADLTVYVLGDRVGTRPLAPHVRFAALRPVLPSAPLAGLVGGVDVTDLAPCHPGLARALPRHDVWHATHVFAFAGTAVRLARRARGDARPALVASVHTDVPALTAAYVTQTAGRLLRAHGGPPPWARPAVDAAARTAAALARRRRDRLLAACDRVLVSTEGELAETRALVGPGRVSLLRRGTDHALFRPDPGARAALTRDLGVPAGATAVLFAGRADASKRVPMLTEAVLRARRRGHDLHLVVVGRGASARWITGRLGPAATVLGPVPQDRLARLYAGCDVFAFPSRTETAGNVVAEAMAAGAPVVLPAGARTARWLAAPGTDGLLVGADDADGWAGALAWLAERPDARRAMGRAAAVTAREHHPDWTRVLLDDVVPVWREAAAARSRPRARPG